MKNPFTAEAILKFVEPIVYAWRIPMLIALILLTVFFGYKASQTFVDAGFDKSIPLEHPYMSVLKKYQADFGGGNTVLVAVIQKEGEIYNEKFLDTLKKATDAVFFLPGVDRSRVTSLFTPNTRYIEVVEGGFAGGNVIPAEYAPNPEMFDLVKSNTAKAGVIGRLVTNDERGAMITSELLEFDPVSNEKLNYQSVAHNLEDKIRGQFTNPRRYEYKLTSDYGELKAGTVVYVGYSEPGGLLGFKTLTAEQKTPDGKPIFVKGADVEWVEADNPDYNPDVDVHIIGFAKVVGDVTDATGAVLLFFAISVLMTFVLLWMYSASFKLSVLVIVCAVVAVVWEFGLLVSLGYGLDPFAILVPFLIVAVSVSHGVQYVNSWVGFLAAGVKPYDASLFSFRRLAIAGTTALITDLAGFLTILLIPIDIIREMAINASLGMAAIIITNKILAPILLTYITVKDVPGFQRKQQWRDDLLDPMFRLVANVVKPVPATIMVTLAAIVFGLSLWGHQFNIIGDAQRGVPELWPDSRYNQDSNAIGDNFAIGTDIIKVIAETKPEACIDHAVMSEVDRFIWHMENTPGVSSVIALAQLAKQVNMGFNEGSPKFKVLPRNRFSMSQSITPIPTSSGLLNPDCSAMALVIFTADHKAETIAHIVNEIKKFEQNKESQDITFSLASGNVGVMAATNEVVHDKEDDIVYWVYGVIIVFLWLSFGSFSGLLCVVVPLYCVSELAYAVMAYFDIGLKVATLPVLGLAVGIGVDYGIYSYSVLREGYKDHHLSLYDAMYRTMRKTGRAILFTGITLTLGVTTWLWSDLKFQADMGLLLAFMFIMNMFGALLLLPALAYFLMNYDVPDVKARLEDIDETKSGVH
ncbi:MAG: efflux RND transporter permease subunit [Nevskiales bacterium]